MKGFLEQASFIYSGYRDERPLGVKAIFLTIVIVVLVVVIAVAARVVVIAVVIDFF